MSAQWQDYLIQLSMNRLSQNVGLILLMVLAEIISKARFVCAVINITPIAILDILHQHISTKQEGLLRDPFRDILTHFYYR